MSEAKPSPAGAVGAARGSRLRAAVLGAVLILSAAACAHPAPSSDLEPALAAAMTRGGPPAMGVLVIRHGRVAGEAVRGVRQLGDTVAVRPGDRWHLGSNTKAFTATLIARLVEQGRLSWTEPLDRMLPQLAGSMRPEYRDVTLADLLSHRAGIREPDEKNEALFKAFYTDSRPLPQQRLAWASAALDMEPIGPKRGKSDYSNTGYIIAAAIAETATGRTYEQLVAQHVLRPLGLRTATFAPPGARGDLVGHVEGRAAGPADGNPPLWNPAGGLRMSLRDYARFCIDQIEGERGRGALLGAATYRFLHARQGEGEALGWSVEADMAGRQGPILQHAGSDGNWYAAVALFPETRDGVLAAANAARSMGGDRAVLQAAMAVLPTLSRPVAPSAEAAKPAAP